MNATNNTNATVIANIHNFLESEARRLASRARRREFRRNATAKATEQGLHGAARAARARKLYQESLNVYRVLAA